MLIIELRYQQPKFIIGPLIELIFMLSFLYHLIIRQIFECTLWYISTCMPIGSMVIDSSTQNFGQYNPKNFLKKNSVVRSCCKIVSVHHFLKSRRNQWTFLSVFNYFPQANVKKKNENFLVVIYLLSFSGYPNLWLYIYVSN